MNRTGIRPPDAANLNLLGVDYTHVKLENGDDLYLTRFGRPFAGMLRPDNWFERDWFERNREKLDGSGTVYRVRTRPVNGRSKDLVVKWCRVGEEVPLDTFTLSKFVEADFNSPYEESALVMEMRADRRRDHNYIAVWGYWNGSDEVLARRDVDVCKPLNLAQALRDGTVSEPVHRQLMDHAAGMLAAAGFEDLNPRSTHWLLSVSPVGDLLRNDDGSLTLRLCSFSLLRRQPAARTGEQEEGGRR
jgi:hypothetical protein